MNRIHLLLVSLLVSAGAALPQQQAAGDAAAFTQLPEGFPVSHYTPHGYIDNPYHSMVAHRSGVIRSVPPLGFGFWRDNFKGSYGLGVRDHVNYLSFLNFSVTVGPSGLITADDLKTIGGALFSAYHSKQMVSYDWRQDECAFSIKYFLPREHTLAAIVEMENQGAAEKKVTVNAVHRYALGEVKWWGSDGLAAAFDSARDISVSKVWAYGDVFAMGSPEMRSSAHAYAASDAQALEWMHDPNAASSNALSVKGRGPLTGMQRYEVTLPPHARSAFLVCLSRGVNEASTRQEYQSASSEARAVLAEQLRADAEFWSRCPLLEGDWAEHWKHGWVYDFETLRMNVRRPLGIFRHPWDAMQVHSPRVVLGETAFDMMTMSYADPALAKEVIYGTFADAPAPNIPCVREDGSMNMISSDGSECGTAPMWGYPFHMVRNIFLATDDREWLSKLYPYLESYIKWWLLHRTDSEGWLHCNNSWESGQDGSRRFLVAEHNEAAVADFVRTVDVEASMAEAMQTMELFASVLGKEEDRARWQELSRQRIANTRSMFHGDWFRDVDARTKKPIILEDHHDVAMLTPLTCSVATPEQVDAIRPMLRQFKDGHEWPPGLFTLAEAAWNAGERQLAAEAVAHTAERVYQRTDAQEVLYYDSAFSYRVPGVANEFWPRRKVPAGGENYGWGATLPMNIIRTIVGFREKENAERPEFYLAPALPAEFLDKGKVYAIAKMQYRGSQFDISYRVEGADSLLVEVKFRGEAPVGVAVKDTAGRPVPLAHAEASKASLAFRMKNYAVVSITL